MEWGRGHRSGKETQFILLDYLEFLPYTNVAYWKIIFDILTSLRIPLAVLNIRL